MCPRGGFVSDGADGACPSSPSRPRPDTPGGEDAFVAPPVEVIEAVVSALVSRPLFKGVDRAVLAAIAARARRRLLCEDDELAIADGESMAVVVSGTLYVRVGSGTPIAARPETVVNTLGMLGCLKLAEDFKPKGYVKSDDQDFSKARSAAKTRLLPLDQLKSHRGKDATENELARSIQNLCPHAAIQLTSETCGRRTAGWVRLEMSPASRTLPNPDSCSNTMTSTLHSNGFSSTMYSMASGFMNDSQGADGLSNDRDDLSNAVLIATLSSDTITDALSKDPVSEECFAANRDALINMWRLLLRSFVFPGAPPEVIWAVAEVSRKETFAEDEFVASEGEVGEAAESLIVIASGEAVVEKFIWSEGKTVPTTAGHLGPGAIIGDFCFLGTRIPRTATVRAVTPLAVLRIPADGMFSVLRRFPGITSTLKGRLREIVVGLQPSLPSRSEALHFLKLFSQCSLEFVNGLAKACERRAFYSGEVIKAEGSTDASLALIEFGACAVEKDGIGMVHKADIGTCVGERTLLGHATHANATVRVLTPLALLLTVTQSSFQTMISRFPSEEEQVREASLAASNQGWEVYRLEVLRHCGRHFISAILESIQIRCYMPGQSVTVEGNADVGSMYIIKGGRAAVVCGGEYRAEITTNACFGELAMLGLVRVRTATVRALSHLFTFEIPRRAFLKALEQHPEEKEHFEKLTMKHPDAATSNSWPIFRGAEPHLLYLVNFHSDRRITAEHVWTTNSGEALPVGCAVQVQQGALSVVDDSGGIVAELTDGQCFNEGLLLGYPDALKGKKLVPKKETEVQLMTKAVFETIMDDYSRARTRTEQQIREEMVGKAEQRLGFARGSTNVLRLSSAFQGVSDAFAQDVRDIVEICTFEPGEAITEEGALGDCMYWLLDGATDACGQVFGETAMLGMTSRYQKTVRATEFCLMQSLSHGQFTTLVHMHPETHQLYGELGIGPAASNVDPVSPSKRSARDFERLCPILSKAGEEFVEVACRQAEDILFAPRAPILKRGDACSLGESSLYILVAGRVVVEAEFEVELSCLRSGDIFGEGGALGMAMLRHATVRARSEGLTHCVRLSGESIKAALDAYPNQYQALVEVFERRRALNAAAEKQRRVWLKETVVPALARTYVFASCDHDLRSELAMRLFSSKHKQGSIITEAGEPCESMMIILSGAIDVESKYGDIVGHLTTGAVVGELAVLGLLSINTGTLRAACDCDILDVPVAVVQEVMAKPYAHLLRRDLEKLIAERYQQVSKGLPLCVIDSLTVALDDVCVRSVALHAERIDLAPGECWYPASNSCPTGQHVAVIASGRASLMVGHNPRPVMIVLPHTIVPEGVVAEYNACLTSITSCLLYRVRKIDLLLSVYAVPNAKRWYALFKNLEAEVSDRVRNRLGSARGAANCKVATGSWRRLMETGSRIPSKAGSRLPSKTMVDSRRVQGMAW